MSLLKRLLDGVFWWREPPDTQQDANEVVQDLLYYWEDALFQFQSVIIWQNPITSFSFVVVFNLLFWLLVSLEWRFYGLLFTGVTLVAVVDCARHFGLLGSGRDSLAVPSPSYVSTSTEDFRVLSASELFEYFKYLRGKATMMYQKVRQLREQQPGSLCAAVCVLCLGLSVFGRAVSGPIILYFILMSILTVPAFLVRFPRFLQYLPILMESSDAAVDDYLPPSSGETIKILSLHETVEESYVTNLPTGDVTLYPDLTSMPSYEHSMDYLLDPDVDMPSPQGEKDSEESDISETKELEFKTKHFKGGSSSSSSGEDLSKGLGFKGKKTERQSSSDSNESFELISKDDL